MSSLLAVSFVMNFLMVLFLIASLILVLLILIQKGRGGGLGAAFGGGAGSLMGTKTGDFLTWVTVGLVVVFLSLAVVMAKFYRPGVSDIEEAPTATSVPAEDAQ